MVFFVTFALSWTGAGESERGVTKNIPYYSEEVLEAANDEYQKKQCVLDISATKNVTEHTPVLVWFHGGGLSGGQKEIPSLLNAENLVIVGVGYRLFPQAKSTESLQDAAAAVAWTFANIEKYGGNPDKIFVGGNSAGGYLTGMIGYDSRWLKPYGLEPSRLAGVILLTGQVSTHFNLRKHLQSSQVKNYPELLQQEYAVIVDEYAPLYHISKNGPPTLLLLGDRKIEWPARVQENEMLYATLRAMQHPHVEFYEHPGFDHGQMGRCREAFERMGRFIEKMNEK